LAGLELAADLVIIGESTSQFLKMDDFLQGMKSSTANIRGRVIRADTSEVIAAKSMDGRAVGLTESEAASKSLTLVSQKVSDYFISEIVKSWKKELKKGGIFDVVIYGVNYEKLNKIINQISIMEGVTNIEKIYFVADKSLLNITFVGDSITLAEKIKDLKDMKLEIVGLSMQKIEIESKDR
jgi:hypothetical protein